MKNNSINQSKFQKWKKGIQNSFKENCINGVSSSPSLKKEMSATTDEFPQDLQWPLQLISSSTPDLQTISFFLSQPSSAASFQETDKSLTVNIAPSAAALFSELLSALASNGGHSSLTNVEFHLVEWDDLKMKDLRTILETNPSIKQLTFKRNKFSPECLSELSEAVRRNDSIKEITVAESGIGTGGAALLASALKENRSLEEFQVWEDSIGLKGAEELAKMIEVNSTLKLLTVFDSNPATAAPLISAALARNRAMEVHIWTSDRDQKTSKVLEFMPGNSTLRVYYNLDISGACRLACSMAWNSTVRSLDMAGVKLKSKWAKEFRWVLEQNHTLKELRLSNTSLKNKAAVYIAAGLFKNQSLEKLYLDRNLFGGVAVEHLLCPLSRFSAVQKQANTTLKSITFGGAKAKIGRDGLAAILQMLTGNQSVIYFGIYDDRSLKPDDIVRIFKSLETNPVLRRLSLQGCKGVQGDAVLQAVIETLNSNPWIEDIDLSRTPLQASGQADGINRILCLNERTREEAEVETDTDLLENTQTTAPKSCRVFLCGQEHAGKGTLCNAISQNISPSKLPYLDHLRNLTNPVEQAVRAPAIKIKAIKDEENTKITIWNLAGQHELYSLHNLMFPGHGSASIFLIISSLFRKPGNREPKTSGEIEEDLQYWLRFIISNSRRAVQQCMLPNITIVLTHHDRINQQAGGLPEATVSSLQKLREKFQGFVEFYPIVFTVDARSSASVSKLSHHVRKTCRTILQRVPRVYQLCNDLVDILSDWRLENHNRPAMKWKEFEELCQVRVPFLRVRSRHDNSKDKAESRRRAVASSLHHIGEVIYFDEMGSLILDCEWFCDILGQITRLDIRSKKSFDEKTGFISRKYFEKILIGSLQSHIPGRGSNVVENLEPDEIIRTMLKLELCCAQDPSDSNSPLLIPSILEDGRWKLQRWQQVISPNIHFVGRRLQCDDSSHMLLTPGFFPRLQVSLHNKIMGSKNQHGASYSLEKYLILININGIHVRVELGGQLGYYIDVLACSTKGPTEMLRLFQQLIIPAIQSLCHEIALTEYVVRSECVKNLTPPRYRRSQCAHLQRLKQALLSVPAESIYDYQHTWDTVTDSGNTIISPGFDFARDLLSDDDFREVLHSRYHDLYNLAMELQVPEENNPDHPSSSGDEITGSVEPTFAGIAKGVEAVLHRLKIIEQEIRDVKQEIQGLRYYEHRLLIELHHKVNYLVNYNIQVEERKVPNMFYFVTTENYSRRLITSMVSGMTALRLHMLCEYRREMHVVEGQTGCELMQVNNITVKCLAPYMKSFMKLLTFALKIGAHLAAGMGEMIPDLGREVAHLINSPALYGAAGAAALGAAGVAAAVNRNRDRSPRDVEQDHRAAQQWVMDFLRDQRCSTGKDIAEKFGLWRVRYRDDGQIAWVCRWHMHARAYEIMEVPI
ncbi:protein TORNADO 1 [Andrographis paniculata]|uniref:protein TORNADO 1 n=1 Tax=Andrographis paniculata TaxID=175694 RepID=UPI0021E8EF51|nr:protein TORNADO 1 [Andrographis paniculata]